MITEKDTIKREAIFNDDKTHRFLWRQVWDSKKPLACVIMINPCLADTKMLDTTTFLTSNNICRLGDYGGVTIVNLFSLLTPKLHFNSTAKLNDEANDSYIKKAAEESSVVILAWGKSVDTNIRLYNRSREVIDLLSDQKEKGFKRHLPALLYLSALVFGLKTQAFVIRTVTIYSQETCSEQKEM